MNVLENVRKRARSWVAVAALAALPFLASSLVTPTAHAGGSKRLSVNVPTANFRSGPSTKHDILFTATKYFPVTVLETKGDWVRVIDFEKEESWVAKRLLTQTPTVVVEVKKGNVRDAPSIKGEVLDKVEYGEVFRIVKTDGRWMRIATPKNVIGWVRDDLTWGEEPFLKTRK